MKFEGQQEYERDLLHVEDVVTPQHSPDSVAGMARLELANQLIEGQPAFPFAFIPAS